ncbi:MAG TPA: lipid-binding SYLF domain-containing protein [Terriglobales bacterium]|jgi:lipid-binding SYLF domain-containing protein|nr:lipid-binding SYLF domain-containing protein [Terriglobales bacterium]
MKKLALLGAMLSLASLCWAGSERRDAIDRLNNTAKVLDEIMAAPDQRIPDEMMKKARCIAVMPHLIKGGFVFGAEHGKAVATCGTAEGWSAPAFIRIAGGSWGTQLGAEALDLVMVIKSEKGMQKLLSSKFEIGRDASVALGPVGRLSSESTDLKLDVMILTYSRAKGAFVGFTFKGALVRPDNRSRRAMYGPRVTTRATLLGRVAAPAAAEPFLDAVRGAKAQAIAQARR